MPEVNGKSFPYTPEGYKAAKAYAKKTGKKIKYKKPTNKKPTKKTKKKKSR